MASEVQASGPGSGRTLYFVVRNSVGQIWNGTAFAAFATANWSTYTTAMTEQGTASNYYTGTFPSTIAAGIYSVTVKQQLGGTAAETDTTVAVGDINWGGSTVVPLSDVATSGLVGQFLPLRLYRGQQILNFPIYFRSSADHVTPFTSGVISGQISRDGGSFGALQSGAFTEIGLGHFNIQALTSGDLLANTVRLHFTAVGISGGSADPVPMGIILQRSSGQAG